MAKKKVNTKKTTDKLEVLKKEKEKNAISKGEKFDIVDFPLLTDEELEQIGVIDTHKDNMLANAWQVNGKKYWSFAEGHRLFKIMMYWLMADKNNLLLDTFLYCVIPKAEAEGIIAPFPGSFITRNHVSRIIERWPQLKEMYDVCRGIQDAKVTEGGMYGIFNASLVQLYLRSHCKSEWTETIKQEIVNKTQIVNIDPFESDEDNN